jgi:hypothetical protein
MYLNAFKNELSTFMKESAGSGPEQLAESDSGWGWIGISQMLLDGKTDLTGNFEYIQEDDGNPDDQTVLKVNLDRPVKPAETIQIDIEFTAKLPEIIARTGYKGDFFMVGQWFPKIGVYESAGDRYARKGQWNCHQFHWDSEFFADYAVYEVSITLPDKFIVGATGVLVNEVRNPDNSKTLTYYCEDVHDFAWAADPDFIVIEDQWGHVKIRFLAHPGHDSQADRHIGAAKIALEFFNEQYGAYPYPALTIVDPRYRAFAAGGMEYPTLITVGTFWLLPRGIRWPEATTIHEFGHQYWYGIIGSNEFEEAWLDEGINTYSELSVMEKYFGSDGGSMISFLGLNIADREYEWTAYRSAPKRDMIVKNSWEYKRGGYGILSYAKPGLMLITLENYLGHDKMKSIMQTYFERYKFKHPTSHDFIKTVNEISGTDFSWFFDRVLYGTDVLDYKVDKISSVEIPATYSGIFGDPLNVKDSVTVTTDSLAAGTEQTDTSAISLSDTTSANGDSVKFMNKVVVAREGEVIFPVEILIRFENGDELLERWDGKDRYTVFEYESSSRIVSAEVDPNRKIWLDINFLNNGKTSRIDRAASLKYSTRWLFWMQNFLHFLTIFS